MASNTLTFIFFGAWRARACSFNWDLTAFTHNYIVSIKAPYVLILPVNAVENTTSPSPCPAPILTPEQLRSYPGCHHFTDEEAQEYIEQLTLYAYVIYSLHYNPKTSYVND